MAFDFKKEYKEFYLPKRTPELVSVPPMTFVAVRGEGDPNVEGGAYKEAVGVLYRIDGYYDFVVPPLEGFWWQPGVEGVDFAHKATFHWIAAIRLPDFVTPDEFEWAKEEAARKKGLDTTAAELLVIDEGLCAQIMHLGPYDDEPATVALLDAFVAEQGLENDMSDSAEGRHHHEIYLSDPRRTAPEKLKTVLRHPVRARD